MNFFYRFDFLAYVRHLNDFQYGIDLRGMSELHATLVLQLYVSWAEERTKKTATMDAIKKKMQAMKMEKDSAMDKADNCEAQAKDANMKADKVRKTIWRGFLTPDITDFRVHIMWIAVPDGRELKTWTCGRSLSGIVGSNPVEGIDVYLLRILCVR